MRSIVESYEPAIEFFVEKLGFELVENFPAVTNDGYPKRWVVVRPHGGQTGILLARADGVDQASIIGGRVANRVRLLPARASMTSTWHIAGWHRPVSSSLPPPRTEPYGKVAVFLDIAGNRWDLIGPS